MLAGGQNYYFHTDAIGSIRTITDSSGQPDWTYSYEPYGTTRTETKNDPMAPKNNARFAGEMLDGHSALYDLRARNFDPSSARFVSPDPHASTNAEPAMNTYGYAADNPLVFVDPAGLHPKTTVEVPAPRVSRQLAAVVGSADGSCTPSPDITPKDLPGPALAAWIKGYEEACQRLHAREADNNRCVGTARWVGGFTFLLAGATFSGISVMLFARLAMMDVASGFGFEAIEGIGGSRLTIALSGLAGIAGFGGAGACLAGLF
jgi:RHS repeat-associated protein